MCFSATASFGASAALALIGSVSMKNSDSAGLKTLSSIPLLLSIQQFTEGIIWLSLTNPEYSDLKNISTVVFLIFAELIWPIFLPVSMLVIENSSIRRKILRILLIFGIIQALYIGYGMIFYPVDAAVSGSHIKYQLDFPGANHWTAGIFYILATGLSPFISGNKRISLIGIIIICSYIFTRLLYADYIISVWCFFAALISIVVLYVVSDLKKHPYKQAAFAKPAP